MKIRTLISGAMVLMALSANAQPYRDPKLSAQERAEDLLGRLTLEEKAWLMEHTSPAIPRLGIPQWNWWNEALHGVGRNGTSTVLPITMAMASSWNDPLVQQAFDAASDEARAKNNLARKEDRCKIYEGLSFWTPNINIFRDPRWGRGQETYGEDPYLTSKMGLAVVRGLQGPEDSKYQKLFACAKHFAVHSGPEWNRHSYDVQQLPPRDLWETYLPAFKALVQEGHVREVMCAYNSIDGEPCCGNNRYLQQILRKEWGFDGIVTSDCWAVNDFWEPGRHGVAKNKIEGISQALIAGTDVECGNAYHSLTEAVAQGLTTEEKMNESLLRLLKGRFELGDFDGDELVEWRKLGPEVIASPEHRALSLRLAREGQVLLKNGINPQTGRPILPLSRDARVAVIGPNAADSVMLWGNYNGFPTHTTTILQGVQNKVPNVTYLHGCGLVEREIRESWFDNMRCRDGQYVGIASRYYNNQNFQGDPVCYDYYQHPMKFDNGGATAWGSGVNIYDFSAIYEGVLHSEVSDRVTLQLQYTDRLMVRVGNDTLVNDWTGHNEDSLRILNIDYQLEKGREYPVEIRYAQNQGSAVLHFDIGHTLSNSDAEILQAVKDADVVIYVGGISPRLEGEEMKTNAPGFRGGDRTSIELPQVQRDMLAMLHKAGKRVVYVNCSGSAIALEPEMETCDAILQAWYAGECAGEAVADVLWGDYNPAGRLPITLYRNTEQLPDFEDYTMQGRTYRYMTQDPLFHFGYGLSYSQFAYSKPAYKKGHVRVNVTNQSDRDGDEVVQVYIRRVGDKTGPNKTLRGYQRVNIAAGKTAKVDIPLGRESFEWWDEQSQAMRILPGTYEVMVGSSSRDKDLQQFTVNIR